MKNNKLICIIQARSTSTRLPGKALMALGNKKVIQRIVDRVNAVNVLYGFQKIENIIVAIPKDDSIKDWCKLYRTDCFEGSESHVLERVYKCAIKYKAKHILRITGDCPFIEPVIIFTLIERYFKLNNGYSAMAFNQRRIPQGWDAEIFSMAKLANAYNHPKKGDKEHVTLSMRAEFEDWVDIGIMPEIGFYKNINFELNTKEDKERLDHYARLL